MTDDSWFADTIRTVYLRQPVSELQELLAGIAGSTLVMNYNPVIQEEMQKSLPIRMKCALHFGKGQVVSALDYVRSKTLDWTLALERRGVVGAELSFHKVDKQEARVVTNNIYGGNIGVLGQVGGDVSHLTFVNGSEIDLSRLESFLDKAQPASAGLDPATRSQIEPLLSELRQQLPRPEVNKVKQTLASIRLILEGAAGNIVAAAIMSAMS